MTSRRGRGRGNRSIRSSRIVRAVNKHQSRQALGFAWRSLPEAPPVVNLVPWFNLTLVKAGVGNIAITISNIRNWLWDQIFPTYTSIPPQSLLRFRFSSIRVWADAHYSAATATGKPLQLQIMPFSLIGESYNEIITDFSADRRYARCGYTWPRTQAVTVFGGDRTNSPDELVRIILSDPSAPWVLYFEMHWSGTTALVTALQPAPPSGEFSELSLGD